MASGGGEPGTEESVSPVQFALDQFAVAVDHLIKVVDDGGLDGFDDAGFVAVMQAVEAIRNRLPVLDHRIITDATRRDLPDGLTQPSMTRLLMSVLRLGPGEASSRVRAAAAVGDRTSMLGQPLAPVRPLLAAAQRAGTVSPEQVGIVERALAKVDGRGFDPADLDAGEQLLVEHAATFGPKELKLLAAQVVDAIDPDGVLPDDQRNADLRHRRLRQTREGAWAGEFRLTGPLGAKLSALLEPLAKPRPDTQVTGCTANDGDRVQDATGSGRRSAFALDPRSRGQRMHDALEELCDRLLRVGDDPVPVTAAHPLPCSS